MALILYLKPGCHLCDEARLAIAHADPAPDVETRDITTDPRLAARYGPRIPVLLNPHTAQELEWPFGPADINALTAD